MNEFSNLSGNVSLGSWSFKVIEISDMNMYSEYIRQTQYPANLWTSNFALLWSISQSPTRKVLWKVVDEMLVTFGYLKTGFLYLICLPFGKGDPDKVVHVVEKCLNYCKEWNIDNGSVGIVKVINNLQLDFLKQSQDFESHFKVIGLVGMEKHFSVEKLVLLSGKDFDTIRRKVNKFHRTCPEALVREYKDSDYNEVMELGESWGKTFGQKYTYIFDDVYFRYIIKHCKELEHLVLVIELKGKLIGMVSGGELPTGESWWCLSKFVDDFDGMSEFLIVELAKEIHKRNPKVQLMNAADDLGPGGLRFFKQRFRPLLDVRKFLLELQ